jgi:hypothetical protein
MALLDAGAEWAAEDPLRAAFDRLRAWRDRVNGELEAFRAAKHKSADAHVTLRPHDDADRAALESDLGELGELLIVSGVALERDDGPEIEVREHGGARCERCWRWYGALAANPNDVCERCAAALAAVAK